MPPRATAIARSPSPGLDTSNEDIVRLAYDTEEELLELFVRMREQLKERVKSRVEEEKGKGEKVDEKKVEGVVLKQFFDKIGPIVLLNCSIAGVPYAQYKKLKKGKGNVDTQAFSDELHQRVLQYQNELFDARELNVRKRAEEPAMAAAAVQEILSMDQQQLEQIEQAKIQFPEDRPVPKPKGRKSVEALKAREEGPTPQQAQEDFTKGKEDIDRLLKEVPRLSTAAERAAKVAVDAAALS